jgi:hypothetical protein
LRHLLKAAKLDEMLEIIILIILQDIFHEIILQHLLTIIQMVSVIVIATVTISVFIVSNSGTGYRYPLDRNIVSTVLQQAIATKYVSTLQFDAAFAFTATLPGFHIDVNVGVLIMIFKAIVTYRATLDLGLLLRRGHIR